MVLKYQISPYPTLMEDMLVRIWEAASDAPASHVYEEVIPEDGGGGHPNIATITANGLDKVVHIGRLYAASSGALLHQWTAEPRENVVTVFTPIRFKIGDGGAYTPAAGDNVYTNPILEGLGDDDYLVMRNNYGLLFPNIHYYTQPVDAQFTLDGSDEFGPNEEITILRQPKAIQTVVNDSVVGKWFAGYVDVTANMTYEAAHLRKLIRFTNTAEYSFGALEVPPANYAFCFQNFGDNSVGTIKFLNEPLIFGSVAVDTIVLPNKSEACFVFDGTNRNVVYLVNSSTFGGSSTPAPGATLGAGNYLVGDVPAGDPIYTINHGLNIAGDYIVLLSIKSEDSTLMHRNNKVGSTWAHHLTDKPNKFLVSLQEISSEVQSISITWLIIKM